LKKKESSVQIDPEDKKTVTFVPFSGPGFRADKKTSHIKQYKTCS